MRTLFQIILLVVLSLNCRAQIAPILRNVFTTNTFDTDIVGGAIPYFDFPSGKFVATGISYTNGIYYDPIVGILSIVHTNSTGDALLVLGEGGPAGASIQGYADKFVGANTNLTLDAIGPFSVRLRVNGSNQLEAVSGGVSLSATTNILGDDGTFLTYNGVELAPATNLWTSSGGVLSPSPAANVVSLTGTISLSGKTNLIGDDGSDITYNGSAIGRASLQSLYYGGQYGFGASSITPTNARSSNLAIGTTDIFTVPAGKRFMLEGVKVGTTNATSTTAYCLLKTNGVYYRFGANSTLSVQSISGLTATGDDFLFESGETVAVNVTQIGANVTVSGLLFSTNVALFTPRLLALSGGNNTLYTCPSGKCAVAPTFPSPLTSGAAAVFVFYINDSGSSRTLTCYVVPSGGSADSSTKQFARTVSDKITFSFPASVLFPGDSLVVASDATTATQWVRATVAEIPFP